MNASDEQIVYEETRETGFLERLLTGRTSGVVTWIMLAGAVVAISMALFHLFVAAFGTPESRSFRSVHLTGMLVLAVLVYPLFRKSMRAPVIVPGDSGNALRIAGLLIDLALVATILFIQVWTIYDIQAFQLRLGEKELSDLIVGSILILIVLEATRRAVGWAMIFITGFFMLHALYANHFFGFLYGPPVRFAKFIDVLFMTSDGIFTIPLHVVSTYIVLFIIFGALLIRSGAGRFFIDLAVSLTGHRIGGPAKASVVASGFMGTVSGSAVANVVTTGSFTIPLMKNLGYRARFAGAIEACASSGGQITPPIMGAAAFIIAENLHTPYSAIIIAAMIPAFLYFATIYFMVHLEAEKDGIGRIEKAKLPDFFATLRRGWHLLVSLGIVVGILIAGYTAMMAAFWGIIALVLLSFIVKATRMSPVDILAALEAGVRATMPVTIACACAGLIIGSVFASGLGLKFTNSVIELSGGNLLFMLALTGVSAIILGMGITTTAVYITVASLIVPALIKIGVEPIAAHMFAFYFGVVSSITPPVALASFAAAAIAKTSPMATAFESTRVGIAKYLVPLVFVYNPSLLFVGPTWLTFVSAGIVFVGLWVLSMAMEGWYRGPLAALPRLLLFAAAALMLMPPGDTVLGAPGAYLIGIGAALAAALVVPRILGGLERGRTTGDA